MLPAYKFAYTSNLLQNLKKKGGGSIMLVLTPNIFLKFFQSLFFHRNVPHSFGYTVRKFVDGQPNWA